MDTRHSDLLNNRLEQIVTEGATYISWNELYMWYDMKAIAAGTYRDIHARWAVITKKHKTPKGKPLGHLMFAQASAKITPGLFLLASTMVKPLENPG